MASEVRARVLAFLADFLELPQVDLHDEFDVVNDFDWSRWDDEDYGLLFELFRYPRVTFSRMTVGDLVGMAERREWDPSLEDTASS